MIGCYEYPSPVFAILKLHGMTRGVCVCAPVFIEIPGSIDLRFVRPVNLRSNLYGFTPGSAIICRCFVPYLLITISFSHLSFMIIPCIIKEENAALWKLGISEVNHRGRVPCLQGVKLRNKLQSTPGFTPVDAALHHDIDVSKIVRPLRHRRICGT